MVFYHNSLNWGTAKPTPKSKYSIGIRSDIWELGIEMKEVAPYFPAQTVGPAPQN